MEIRAKVQVKQLVFKLETIQNLYTYHFHLHPIDSNLVMVIPIAKGYVVSSWELA